MTSGCQCVCVTFTHYLFLSASPITLPPSLVQTLAGISRYDKNLVNMRAKPRDLSLVVGCSGEHEGYQRHSDKLKMHFK